MLSLTFGRQIKLKNITLQKQRDFKQKMIFQFFTSEHVLM